MSRPERRKSSLAGTSPLTPPPVAPAPEAAPAAPAAEVAPRRPAARIAPSTSGGGEPGKPTRTKMNYYASTNQDGRIRAAFYAGRDRYGWRNMTDMQLQGVMGLVEELEKQLNGGEEFEPMPPGTGPVGRPLE